MMTDKTGIFLDKIREKMTSEGNDDRDLNMVFLQQAIRSAEEIFNSSIWIFHTYTDHKIVHARNVVRIIYQLLNEMQIFDRLNSQELALCLLSAYYHDTGMFLTSEEEKRYLAQSKQRRSRQRRRGAAPIREQGEENPAELLQNYIRKNHGKFVSAKLQQVQESTGGEFRWIWMEKGNRREIEKELAVICASHNDPVKDLAGTLQKNQMDPERRNVNYMLCCAVLRIADLLDFDQKRASQIRYYSAGLTDSNLTENEQFSKEEMQKHMQSCGFEIKRTDRSLNFRISAQPRDPYFESKIRTFAGNVRTEIAQSLEVLDSYTIKFIHSFPSRKGDFSIGLIVEVNTDGIIPNGYESGEYRFQASKEEILQYFTGEKLYSDRTVFFRELLQNAIDTCLFAESTDRYSEDEEPYIEIAYWIEKGSRWLQITDNGAGMDRTIIQDYFLKVGASFYNSPLFRRTFAPFKKRNTFTAISRFGIGILSCFMVSNHIEIATRSRGLTSDDNSLYHLLMLNTNDQYTLRRDHQIQSFPNKDKLDLFFDGYGTSIVLKLNPDIGFSNETIWNCLQEFIFLPEVNIYYLYNNHEECVRDTLAFSETRCIHQLNHAESENVIRYYNGPHTVDELYRSPLRIYLEVLSLDIGKHCDDSDINGYLYAALIYDETMTEKSQEYSEYSGFTFHYTDNTVMLKKNQQILAITTISNANSLGADFDTVKVYFNGVLHAAASIQGKPYYSVCGNISLGGTHRPDVNVSRDANATFSLETLSRINHAFRSAVRSQTKENRRFRHIYEGVRLPSMLCYLGEIPVYSAMMEAGSIENLWMNERIIRTELGAKSINEIKEYLSAHEDIQLRDTSKSKYIVNVISTYLVQKYLKVKARFRDQRIEIIAHGINEPEDQIEALQCLPCLFFVEYEGLEHLRVENAPYNINHPLSQKIIDLAENVNSSDNDPSGSYFQLLLDCLTTKYNQPDLLNQNLITPVNQVLSEMGISMTITDRDFIIGPEYEFELLDEVGRAHLD